MTDKSTNAVLITGASSGIGHAVVERLDRCGYLVFAGVRNAQDMDRLKKEHSDRTQGLYLDITKPDQIAAAVETVAGALKPDLRLSAIVNNAGIGVGGPLEFLSINDLRRQLEVNVIGHIAVTQSFLPLIRKGNGRIVNMGSMAGRVALPFSGPYAISKFAIEAFSDALRRELTWWDIPVILIEPGSVDTPIWDKSFSAVEDRVGTMPEPAKQLYEKALLSMNNFMLKLVGHAISPETVARVVLKAIQSNQPKTRYVVGFDARLGQMIQLLPDRLFDWALKREQENL